MVDLDIPFRLGGFASTTIQLMGIVGVMTKVTWQVLLLVIPMAIACLWMQVIKFYCPELVLRTFSYLDKEERKWYCSMLASISS